MQHHMRNMHITCGECGDETCQRGSRCAGTKAHSDEGGGGGGGGVAACSAFSARQLLRERQSILSPPTHLGNFTYAEGESATLSV